MPAPPPQRVCQTKPGARATIAATLAIASLTALTIWGAYVGQVRPLLPFDVAVGFLATALVPVLLRRPVLGAVAAVVLAALSPAATPLATGSAVVVARWRSLPIASAVAGFGVVAHAGQGLWRPYTGLPYGWWLVLLSAAYAALVAWGALIQSNRALIASLHERAVRAEAERDRQVRAARMLERTHIAREMHDVLAHRLSLLVTYAGAVEYRPDARPEQLARAAAVVRDSAHQALTDLRDVIAVLRDPSGSDGDPVLMDGPPQPVWADIPRLVRESRDAGAAVTFDDRTEGEVPAGIGRTAYRIVQEGLTNARRHAPGRPVRVAIGGQRADGLTIDVSNPVPENVVGTNGSGMGLIGLGERVRLAGGRFEFTTADGEFRLRAWLPWPRDRERPGLDRR